ncbi:hypothetical protein NKH77_07055 [Streptomyces sp. M19]
MENEATGGVRPGLWLAAFHRGISDEPPIADHEPAPPELPTRTSEQLNKQDKSNKGE